MRLRRICLSKSFSSGFVQTFAALHFSPNIVSVPQVPFSFDGIGGIAKWERDRVRFWDNDNDDREVEGQFVWANATRACSAFALLSFKRKAAVSSSLPLPL